MGCCGRKSYSTTVTLGTSTINIAEDGVSQVEYIGSRTPGETFTTWGFYTLTQYRVVPGKYFMVDNRDLIDTSSKKAGILQQLEGNQLRFALVDITPEVVDVSPVIEDEPVINLVQDFTQEDIAMVDPSLVDTTAQVAAKNIKEANLTVDELDQLYAIEYAGTEDGIGGKNRVTVLRAIEDAKAS